MGKIIDPRRGLSIFVSWCGHRVKRLEKRLGQLRVALSSPTSAFEFMRRRAGTRLKFGFRLTLSTNSPRITSAAARRSGQRTSTPASTDSKAGPSTSREPTDVIDSTPERRTTYMWNVYDLHAPWADAFWLGWADGFSVRTAPGKEERKLTLGWMYNAELYDLGLSLGHRGVNARDAMAHLVTFSRNMAILREERIEAQREDLPDESE